MLLTIAGLAVTHLYTTKIVITRKLSRTVDVKESQNTGWGEEWYKTSANRYPRQEGCRKRS